MICGSARPPRMQSLTASSSTIAARGRLRHHAAPTVDLPVPAGPPRRTITGDAFNTSDKSAGRYGTGRADIRDPDAGSLSQRSSDGGPLWNPVALLLSFATKC